MVKLDRFYTDQGVWCKLCTFVFRLSVIKLFRLARDNFASVKAA